MSGWSDLVRFVRRWSGAVVLCGCLAIGAPAAWAQAPAALSGRVTDPEGQPIEGVLLTLQWDSGSMRRTVLSDGAGSFHFRELPPGSFRLHAQRLGYADATERRISLSAGEHRRLVVRLEVAGVPVEEVVVRGRRDDDRERERFETEPGVTARVVSAEALRVLPGLAEADVLRAVEMLPGVVSTSDLSSSFNVRGGSADQNLILLDGIPIFNPFHLGGLFSVFNADAVARVELLAGGFGAEYGGRVSSVLNVESDARVPDGMEVQGGISLLASRVLLRSRLPDAVTSAVGGKQGSWSLSVRRSYFDQLLRPWVDFPYYLADLQGHAGVETRGGGRISVSGYTGTDVLDLSDFRPSGSGTDTDDILRVRWRWGNRVLGARWQQPVGRHWTGDTRLGFSSFAEELGFVDFGDVRFASRIAQLSLYSDWKRDLAPGTMLRLGLGLERLRYDNLGEAGGTEFFAAEGQGLSAAAYTSIRWRPEPEWLVEPGVRLETWFSGGTERVLLAPRFSLKRFLGAEEAAAVKLSVGRYAQYLHSLRDEELPISNDTWLLAEGDVPPVVSDQVQVGVESFWGEAWQASAEAYLRTFRGLTDFNLADDPNDPTDDLLSGRGRSYGLDLLLRRTSGPLRGWATVSLLRAEQTLPDPRVSGWSELPAEITFPPIFDRRLDVDIALQYRLPWKLELGARWNYGSPLPYTRPVGQYFSWRHNPLTGEFEPGDARGDEQPPLFVVLGQRNAERYPPYHRLDVSLRRTFEPRWGTLTPYLQVLNLYNRRNVLFYFYRYDRTPPTRSGLSMFPVLPALGLDFKF